MYQKNVTNFQVGCKKKKNIGKSLDTCVFNSNIWKYDLLIETNEGIVISPQKYLSDRPMSLVVDHFRATTNFSSPFVIFDCKILFPVNIVRQFFSRGVCGDSKCWLFGKAEVSIKRKREKERGRERERASKKQRYVENKKITATVWAFTRLECVRLMEWRAIIVDGFKGAWNGFYTFFFPSLPLLSSFLIQSGNTSRFLSKAREEEFESRNESANSFRAS